MLLTQQVSVDATCDGRRHKSTHQSKVKRDPPRQMRAYRKGTGRQMCAAGPGQDPPTANMSAIGYGNGGTHACAGVHLTSEAVLRPAVARRATSSYCLAGTHATAGSIDQAKDFIALNGLAPEPFRQAGN